MNIFINGCQLLLLIIFSLAISVHLSNATHKTENEETLKLFETIQRQLDSINQSVYSEITDGKVNRQKRQSHFKKNNDCSISKNKLIEFKDDMKSLLKNSMDIDNYVSNCDITEEPASNCNELIKYLLCSVSHLRSEYKRNMQDNMSSEKFTAMKNAYDKLLNEFNRFKDDLNVSNERKFKTELDKLATDLQTMQRRLTVASNEIIQKTIKLCAADIYIGRIEQSLKIFDELKNENSIDILLNIINAIYQNYISPENKIEKLSNVINFLKGIDDNCQQFAGYVIFLNRMLVENHISCPSNEDIWSSTKESILTWEKKTKKLQNCTKNYHDHFRTYTEKNIYKIYSKCIPNVESAINLIDELLTPEQQLYSYPILFDDIKKRNGFNGYEIVLLAYRITELMQKHRKLFNMSSMRLMKSQFPKGVQMLMADSFIYMRSRVYNNKRFALNGNTVSVCNEVSYEYQEWMLTAHDRGRYFQFKNMYNLHSMRADENGKVFVTTGYCLRHQWEIIPVENGTYFYIKNRHYNSILGVDTGTKLNSNCYTVSAYNNYNGQSFQHWMIE